MKEAVYPIIIKMKSKEVQIGSAKVEFNSGSIKNSCQREHDVILKDIKLNFKIGDWITKILSHW